MINIKRSMGMTAKVSPIRDESIEIIDGIPAKKVYPPFGLTSNKGNPNYVRSIPLAWIQDAIKLPGCALKIGVVIWFYYGVKNGQFVSLSAKRLDRHGVERSSYKRGLNALEKARLIEVIRDGKKALRVRPIIPSKIVDIEDDIGHHGNE
jgi:hypothetical protein